MAGAREEEITALLAAVAAGEPGAVEGLLPAVYDEMKALAHARLAGTPGQRTIQTTDLVHESWMRLLKGEKAVWENRRHFFGAAARAMRNILVEQARRRTSLKRDASRKRGLDEDLPEILTDPPIDDVLSLSDALEKLGGDHPRSAEVVTLRFFGGLTMEEVATTMRLSLATVERDWRFARAWLQHELEQSDA